MEILRVAPYQIEAVLEVSAPSVAYDYTVLDMADNSISLGIALSDLNSKVSIELPSIYDNQYTISIDGEEYVVDVVRPYVDSTTKGSTASEVNDYKKHEELARAIIDSVIRDGFYYKKKVYETTGLGADILPVWQGIKKLDQLYENNVLIFDSSHPEDFSMQYGVTRNGMGVHETYEEAINRSESAPLVFPAAASDLMDTNFSYRGFPKGFDYVIVGQFGYKKIPSDIVKAAELLIDDIACGKLDYYKRYISDYNTDQFKIKFDSGVFAGTGNILVDKILSKYQKPVGSLGVL